ncbi:MAG: thiamine pyrophosphate-binding protein [Alphaproteobacteria bacterium]|nr:thiamine pyrophosphate-binding protein [Alphaproteobacteria bacterium]
MMTAKTRTGAQYIAEALCAYGVTHTFFVDAILRRGLIEMEKRDVTRVLTHTEKAAAYMADGYSRAAGRIGVCMAQAVGAANLASGLQDAFFARSAVLAITGHKAYPLVHRHAYQELPHEPLFRPVTRFSAQVETAAQLPFLLRQAVREATGPTPGPAHLDFSGHMGELVDMDEVTGPLEVDARHAHYPAYRYVPPMEEIEAAANMIGAAQRPVLVIGTGAAQSGAGAELLALANRTGAPIAMSLGAKGLISDRDPVNVGIMGHYSAPHTNKTVYQADLVVFVGCYAGDLVTDKWRIPAPGTRVLQIDPNPAELGRNYRDAVGLCGDPKLTLALLAKRCPARADQSWLKKAQVLRAEWQAQIAPRLRSDARPIAVERLCHELTNALPRDAILVADTGYSGVWTGTLVDTNGAGQTYLRAAGSLGWAFPAAMGAKCAAPDRPVVCFSGDGAFYYHMAELETAKRWNIPLTVVINNNSALGQCIAGVRDLYKGNNGRVGDMYDFVPVNFANIAEEFGCKGIRVENPSDLGDALRAGIASGVPCVIDVATDPEAIAPEAWAPPA